jgi:hypothetical protein
MPRHHDVSYSLLTSHGIETIRRPIADYGVDRNPVGTLWWQLTRDHPACDLLRTDGIVETTCTPHPSLAGTALPVGQRPASRRFRPLPRRLRESLHRRYLERAIELAASGEHVHLWAHLYNMANDSQWRSIRPAFESLSRARDEGDVIVRPMNELPDVVS